MYVVRYEILTLLERSTVRESYWLNEYHIFFSIFQLGKHSGLTDDKFPKYSEITATIIRRK